MAEKVFAWIKRVALLNEDSLKEEINQIHQSSLKAFARALSKVQIPNNETLTLQDGIMEQHPHAETINLLKEIEEQTISAINANVPVSPIQYDVSPHGCKYSHQSIDQKNHHSPVRDSPRQRLFTCSFTDTSIHWPRPMWTGTML
jgi:hypothetical protein